MAKLNVEGTFIAMCEEPSNGWFGEAGENQTPYIRIPLVVNEGDCLGEEIEWTGWLSDKAFESTIRTLVKAFGWDGDIAALEAGRSNPFAGKLVEIVCEFDTYKGKTRLKVLWLNNPNGGGAKKMDAGKLASLVRTLGRQSMAIAKTIAQEEQTGAAPTRGATTRMPPLPPRKPVDPDLDVDGDDVPF